MALMLPIFFVCLPQLKASEPIRIGVLVALGGAYGDFGKDAIRGVDLAINEFGGYINDRPLQVIVEHTDGSAKSLNTAVEKILGKGRIELVVGPLTGHEDIALHNIAKMQPNITFINGSSAMPYMALGDGLNNYFRFSPDVNQWTSGLASYVFNKLGILKVVTVGEDYSFPFMQIFAFTAKFCSLGGEVVKHYWVNVGDNRLKSVAKKISMTDAEAIFIALEGPEAIVLTREYRALGGKSMFIGGPATIDNDFLNEVESELDDYSGTIFSSPIPLAEADDNWYEFVKDYKNISTDWSHDPSLFAFSYYVNTKALLLALDYVDADLSEQHEDLRDALSDISFEGPTGRLSVDEEGQAIVSNFVFELVPSNNSLLKRKLIKTMKRVDRRLDIDEEDWNNFINSVESGVNCPKIE